MPCVVFQLGDELIALRCFPVEDELCALRCFPVGGHCANHGDAIWQPHMEVARLAGRDQNDNPLPEPGNGYSYQTLPHQ